MMVIHHIIKWVSKGVKVHYITGNHDEMLRKFAGFKMGSLEISNKLLLDLNDQKTWIFHGDVFDVTMEHSRWLAKLGAHGYDLLILINAAVNWFSVKVGGEKLSLSKNIKNGVKSAVKFINQFEQTAADIAIENGYETVICGHIHQPEMRTISTPKGQVQYLNSGDWIENLSALEYHKGTWRLYHYQEADFQDESIDEAHAEDELLAMKDGKDLFQSILGEFQRESNYVIKSSK
jgi:UDP-2,3-diacylglucosamine pyrophosphatase LpxH